MVRCCLLPPPPSGPALAHHSVAPRSLHTDRRCLKSIPKVQTIYDVDMTQAAMKDSIQHRFRVNTGETDPRVADMLCAKGEMDLEETLLYFKQKAHLLRILQPEGA